RRWTAARGPRHCGRAACAAWLPDRNCVCGAPPQAFHSTIVRVIMDTNLGMHLPSNSVALERCRADEKVRDERWRMLHRGNEHSSIAFALQHPTSHRPTPSLRGMG